MEDRIIDDFRDKVEILERENNYEFVSDEDKMISDIMLYLDNYKANIKKSSNSIDIENICKISFFKDSIEIITNRYRKDFRYRNNISNLKVIKKTLDDIIAYG